MQEDELNEKVWIGLDKPSILGGDYSILWSTSCDVSTYAGH
jgi:hypothetical protein